MRQRVYSLTCPSSVGHKYCQQTSLSPHSRLLHEATHTTAVVAGRTTIVSRNFNNIGVLEAYHFGFPRVGHSRAWGINVRVSLATSPADESVS